MATDGILVVAEGGREVLAGDEEDARHFRLLLKPIGEEEHYG